MNNTPTDFRPVEIDELEQRIVQTVARKRIPSLRVEDVTGQAADEGQGLPDKDAPPVFKPSPRKPLSLEVPDYLATRLKVDAAQQSVTVRHLVLSALADAGYDIKPVDMDEDGRRLR